MDIGTFVQMILGFLLNILELLVGFLMAVLQLILEFARNIAGTAS